MEENLEISKSKFFLSFSLSLSEKKKERRNSLSLFSLSLSLFTFLKCLSFVQRRCVLRARTERERERERLYDIRSRRFVSLFTKCVSLVVVGVCVGFLKK